MALSALPNSHFVRVKDVARLLGIHPRTLYDMLQKGKGPRYLTIGNGKRRDIRIRYSDYLKWTEERLT
jgi:excisionase family DNA binding protein